MKVSRIVSIALTFGLISYGAYAADSTVNPTPSEPNPITTPAPVIQNPLDQIPTSITEDDSTDDEINEDDDADEQLEDADDDTIQSDDSADDESDFEDD